VRKTTRTFKKRTALADRKLFGTGHVGLRHWPPYQLQQQPRQQRQLNYGCYGVQRDCPSVVLFVCRAPGRRRRRRRRRRWRPHICCVRHVKHSQGVGRVNKKWCDDVDDAFQPPNNAILLCAVTKTTPGAVDQRPRAKKIRRPMGREFLSRVHDRAA